MSERLGVGIICFERPKRAAAALRSIRQFREQEHDILLFDNTENDEVGEWARHHAADAQYVRSPYNVGCSIARNRCAEILIARGCTHLIVQDDDIEWAGGDAAVAMRDVFARHPDTGIASWFLATKQMSPDYKPDDTGVVPEIPGACCMFSAECIRAVVKQAEKDGCPYCRAWNSRILMFRFDTLFSLMAAKAGFATRVVWPDTGLIRHNHPHGGITRHPRWHAEQARSRGIFREEVKRHGLVVPKGLGG